jgi:hypothetical protein
VERITPSKESENEQAEHEHHGEHEKLVNQASLALQMHEDQGNQAGFESSDKEADCDIGTAAAEVIESHEPRDTGAYQEKSSDDPDELGLLLQVFRAVVIVMVVCHGNAK